MHRVPVARPSALIVGLAREGLALAQFLANRGLTVTITDAKPATELSSAIAALADLPVHLVLGGHPPELLDKADLLFVSPGVPLETPLLIEARRRGIALGSETRLFAHLCPALICAVTGSSGKTTTTAMVGEMLRASGMSVWVGGNIGRPLLSLLDQIQSSDSVVLELSSFQLDLMRPWAGAIGNTGVEVDLVCADGWSPHVAGLLNVTPNHLDRHRTMEAYTDAKCQIVAHQANRDYAVLNLDDPVTRSIGQTRLGAQKVLWFSLKQPVEEGAFLQGDSLVLRIGGTEQTLCTSGELKLLGRHNIANVLAAAALAAVGGAAIDAIRGVSTSFTGVEHRLELVRTRAGVRWYNDSIATTPERAMAAIQAFSAPIVLLAGGKDKDLPWEQFAELAWTRVRHLILFGHAARLIERAMLASPASVGGICRLHHAGDLPAAVRLAARLAEAGDVVLLSPGGTSFDAYRDFADRGVHFRSLAWELE